MHGVGVGRGVKDLPLLHLALQCHVDRKVEIRSRTDSPVTEQLPETTELVIVLDQSLAQGSVWHQRKLGVPSQWKYCGQLGPQSVHRICEIQLIRCSGRASVPYLESHDNTRVRTLTRRRGRRAADADHI